MDKLLQQLTHDDAHLKSEWANIFEQISHANIPDQSILVLNALTDYLLANPIDSVACYEKYVLISEVIDKLVYHGTPIEMKDLISVFIRVLDSGKTNQLYLHFLETVYRGFQVGEQLSSDPIQTDLIKAILQSLQNKNFVFKTDEDTKNWNLFLTRTVFSSSANDNNILNKQNIIENMQTVFQQLYKHAVQQSRYSTIWLDISQLLHESSSQVFNDNLKWDIILSEAHLINEDLPSTYIEHLIHSDEISSELVKAHSAKLMAIVDHLILVNNYDVAGDLLRKSIILNLKLINIEELLGAMMQLCLLAKDKKLFCSKILADLILSLGKIELNKNLALVCFNLSLTILKFKLYDAPYLAYHLLSRKNFYPWKDLMDGLVDMVSTCISYETIIYEVESFSDLNQLENIIDLIHRKAQNYPQLLKMIHSMALNAVLRWSNSECHPNDHVYRMGSSLLNFVDVRLIDEEICLMFVDSLLNRAKCAMENTSSEKIIFFNNLARSLADFIIQRKRLSHSAHTKLAACFMSLLDYSFYDEDHNMTFQHLVLVNMLFKTASIIISEDDARIYEPFLDRLFQDAKTNDQTELYQLWIYFWLITGTIVRKVAIDHLAQFIDYTINHKDTILASLLLTLSIDHVDPFYPHFNEIVTILLTDDGQFLTHFIGLFTTIVKKSPDIVTPEVLDNIFSAIDTIPFNHELFMMIQALSSVAARQPYLIDKHFKKLTRLVHDLKNPLIFDCFQTYIVASILHKDDELGVNESLTLLTNLLRDENCSENFRKAVIHTCLLLGLKHKQLLACRREEFTGLDAHIIVHFIDDTVSSETDQWMIKQTRLELEQMEQNLEKSKTEQEHKESDIDHIPEWLSQVAELLNPPSNSDWHLVAKKLGFSSSEIQLWSTEKNSCMALLKEWFTTHTIEDAIYSLAKVTSEIGRYDVERFIHEESLKSQQTIPSDYKITVKRLPQILISFHSNSQMRVSKLKLYLEKTGYDCQLHNEQAETDVVSRRYISAAKVIIFCIDMDFEQSNICLQLLQSILATKKPYILLYMEKNIGLSQSKLQTIVQDYYHTEFYDDENTELWSENKFIELLGHIRYYVVPNLDIISSEYCQWFVPRAQSLIFLKPYINQEEPESMSFNSIPLVITHPQIIISYQWDCQRDVLSLYEQLTQRGYRVWLDIFQMNSNDSLIEKFDMMIRQSSCFIACITPKYTQCHHCQYEISLASTLHKPIIPLLFEETESWSSNDFQWKMFDEKTYINFQHTKDGNKSKEKQFLLLLGQLQRLLPSLPTDKPGHLLDMQRPISASPSTNFIDQRSQRISSAPHIPQSQVCSLM